MIASGFGTAPYRWHPYGPVSAEPAEKFHALLSDTRDELSRLQLIAELLKQGDWSAIDWLLPLLSSKSADTRLYASQLLADVCSHRHVPHLYIPTQEIQEAGELQKQILFLGKTLSPAAIPVLLKIRSDSADTDLDGYFHTALHTILPVDGVDEYTMDEVGVDNVYARALESIDPAQYYFDGQPVFAGDLTKEIITAAGAAYHDQTEFKLSFEPKILSNFSGIPFPIAFGTVVTDAVFRAIIDYSKEIAAMDWTKGKKYFYGRPVPDASA